MKISDRLKVWRKLAQTATPSTPASTSAPAATTAPAPTINLTQIPNFKINLFSIKSDFTQSLLDLINLVNKSLYALSGGQVKFSDTWEKPSSGDALAGSLKNLYQVAKFIYQTITANGPQPYSIPGLRELCRQLTDMIAPMTFPEPQATTVKADITNMLASMTNKLGV